MAPDGGCKWSGPMKRAVAASRATFRQLRTRKRTQRMPCTYQTATLPARLCVRTGAASPRPADRLAMRNQLLLMAETRSDQAHLHEHDVAVFQANLERGALASGSAFLDSIEGRDRGLSRFVGGLRFARSWRGRELLRSCRRCAKPFLGSLPAKAHQGVRAERDRSDKGAETAFTIVVVLFQGNRQLYSPTASPERHRGAERTFIRPPLM